MKTSVRLNGTKMHVTRSLQNSLGKKNNECLGYYQDSSMDVNHRIERWYSKPIKGDCVCKNILAISNDIQNK